MIMGKHRLILLVEDDQSVRRYVSIGLRREGYQMHEAENGRQRRMLLNMLAVIW